MGTARIPWVLYGDFNIIKNDSERRGGRPRPFVAMEEFNQCIQTCGLLEMCSKGPNVTWCNGQGGQARSWARFDRCFLDTNFLSSFSNVSYQVLARSTSDHSPLVIQMGENLFRYGPSPFRFQYMWTDHLKFYSFVEGVWKREGLAHGLINLSSKLQRVKVALKEYNKSVFGKTNIIITGLEARIDNLESRLQVSFNAEDDSDLLASKLELLTWLGREDIRLAHMAKKSWLKDEDQNSKFFHAYLKAKLHKRVQEMSMSDGRVLQSPLDIHKAAVDHFQEFLGQNSSHAFSNLSDLISPIITNEDNLTIGRDPSIEEVKDALFSIPIDSSLGPDGFGSGFFRVCWDLVKDDLLSAIVEFFYSHMLPRNFTASYIVLIPKVDKPSGFDKFRPISLCSVVYKICSKIIVARMTSLLPKMISQEQGAFIPVVFLRISV
ncbi:hypothetical protein F2P56_032773 [Juglans regia]|uniref:Uncharacterized protein LOC108990081 n=2 Tax=Juglans regia TaxID=51240 RepID=A0A2I4EJ98_JUGRE|nr:uncharacterized protein LOC108990081 [Juglans regia]KAF5447204.1 hypothetical protein F2P56_032773 [Juglans regia]